MIVATCYSSAIHGNYAYVIITADSLAATTLK